MDSYDISILQERVDELRELYKKHADGVVDGDDFDESQRKLGDLLGHHAYRFVDDNEYELDQDVLQEFENVGLGTIQRPSGFPVLVIEVTEDESIEVPIVNPTRQYPD